MVPASAANIPPAVTAGTVPPGRFAELRVPVAGRKARDVSGGTLLDALLPVGPPLGGISLENAVVDTRGYPRRPGLQARLTVIMIYVSNTGCMIFTHQGPNSAPLRHHGAIEPSDPLGYLLLLPSIFHQRHECVSPVALPNVAPARWSTSCSCRLYLRPLPCVA